MWSLFYFTSEFGNENHQQCIHIAGIVTVLKDLAFEKEETSVVSAQGIYIILYIINLL